MAAACLASVLLLWGCGKESVEKTEEGYKQLTLFSDVEFWNPPDWSLEEGSITRDITDETGVVVDVVDAVEDTNRQLSLMLVNNQLPDIISVTDSITQNQLVSSGKVWKLDELLKKYEPDSHLLKEFPGDVKYELKKRDGGWYAYPSHMTSADNRAIWKSGSAYDEEIVKYGGSLMIMWNKELLGQLGKTTEDLRTEEQVLDVLEQAQHCGITVAGEEMIPLLVDGQNWQEYTVELLRRIFGAEYVDADGNYIDPMLQPEMKDALKFLNKVMQKGYAQPEQFTLLNDNIKELLKTGRVLCFIGNKANTSIDARDWVTAGTMIPSTGKLSVYGKNVRATTGWINTFISKDCEHPEAVAKFLDYMTSEEGMLRWYFGEEGVDYVRNAEGMVVRTEEGEKNKSNYTESGIGAWWMFENTDWNRYMQADPQEESEEAISARQDCIYAKDPHVVVYDESLLRDLLPQGGDNTEYQKLESEIIEWKKEQVTRVVLSDSEEEFEQEYERLIEGLKERQIDRLDARKNEKYQKACNEYGTRIEKVN